MSEIGLLKAAPSMNQVKVENVATQPLLNMVDGAPLDILRHFNIDTKYSNDQDIAKVKDIYNLLQGRGDIDFILAELSIIERKLGYGSNETRQSRVWNYLKINDKIRNLEVQKKAMENA